MDNYYPTTEYEGYYSKAEPYYPTKTIRTLHTQRRTILQKPYYPDYHTIQYLLSTPISVTITKYETPYITTTPQHPTTKNHQLIYSTRKQTLSWMETAIYYKRKQNHTKKTYDNRNGRTKTTTHPKRNPKLNTGEIKGTTKNTQYKNK